MISGSSLNETPPGERAHIGFFGVRNAGKSSLVNAVTGQDLAVVSNTPGTTTDPVQKSMELLPIGPVIVIDTPGIDDAGGLGQLRVEKARRALDATDLAVLVVDSTIGLGEFDRELLAEFGARRIPYVTVSAKSDLLSDARPANSLAIETDDVGCKHIHVFASSKTGDGIEDVKRAIGMLAAPVFTERKIVSDLLRPGDIAVLVVPIDSAAPKGRIILPQQQVIRDCVEAKIMTLVTSVETLADALEQLSGGPAIVITDSQVIDEVAKIVPDDVPLTSFSILMARYKCTLSAQIEAASALDTLRDEDKVLISEGCTHHRQCDDIGTVKLPQWICEICGAEPDFSFTSGGEFPGDVSEYAAVVHCGGCMLNAREMEHRAQVAASQNVPFTNYGMCIAKAHGLFDRALNPLRHKGREGCIMGTVV